MSVAEKLSIVPATANENMRARELIERQAFEAFKAFVLAFHNLVSGADTIPSVAPQPTCDVLTADEAAVFLGVDRNTVYDYANRGVIPHQRLGKRILFGRTALVSWLDSSLCKATSTRKG